MCLGVPVRIISLGDAPRGEVEIEGVRREVDLSLVPEAVVGDYVLLHAGFAIQRIDEAEAEKTLRLLEEMFEAEN